MGKNVAVGRLEKQCANLKETVANGDTALLTSFVAEYLGLLQKAVLTEGIETDAKVLQSEFQKLFKSFANETDFMKFISRGADRLHSLVEDQMVAEAQGRRMVQDFTGSGLGLATADKFSIPAARESVSLPKRESGKTGRKKAIEDLEFRRRVFVVHGRNLQARDAMFDFLSAIGLDPVEWSHARKLTRKPTPYIGEILDAAFSHARAIVVLVTGDDLARLGRRFTEGQVDEELTPQARPNVIFEAGMAFGRDEMRVVLVELGDGRDISDLAGRHTVRLDNTPEKRMDLGERLETAGCKVQMKNKRRWLAAGDFEGAVVPPDDEAKRSVSDDPGTLEVWRW